MSISLLISMALGIALLALSAGLLLSLLREGAADSKAEPVRLSPVVAVSPFAGAGGQRSAALLSQDLAVALASIDQALTVGAAGARTELIVAGSTADGGKTIDIELRAPSNGNGSQPSKSFRVSSLAPGDPYQLRGLATIVAGLLVGMRRLPVQPERFRSLLATLTLAAASSGNNQAVAVECLEQIAGTSVARDIRRDSFQALRRGIAVIADPAARRAAELRFAARCLSEGITEQQSNLLWDAIDYCRRGSMVIDEADGSAVTRRLIEAEAFAALAATENESLHLVAAREPLHSILATVPPGEPSSLKAATLLVDVELRRANAEIGEAPLQRARDYLEHARATLGGADAATRRSLSIKLAQASMLVAERTGGVGAAERALADARRLLTEATTADGSEPLAELALVGRAEWLLGEATGDAAHFQSAVRTLGKAAMADGIGTDAPSVTSVLATVPAVPHLNGAASPLLERIRSAELHAGELKRRLAIDTADDDLRAEIINTLDTLKSYYQHLGFPVRSGAVAAEIVRLERS